MRRLIIGLILSVIGFGCQSSSSQSATKHSVRSAKVNIGAEPQTLDPRKARDLNAQAIVRMLFEGLVRIDQNEKPELAAAESVEISEDLKTYTFHLRASKWTNGDPLKASDFVYSWKRVLSPDFLTDTAFHLYVIKNAKAAKEGKTSLDEVGVRAIDEQTLVVELENPTPYFLNLVTVPAFFPVNQSVDEANLTWSQNVATYVSNGPFQLVDWKHQDYLHLDKNERYWDQASVKLASLELLMVHSETEFNLFQMGQLDWAGSPLSTVPVDAIKSLKSQNLLKAKESLGTYFIRLNTKKHPFQHSSMRKAFAFAINRQEIVEHVTQGGQRPATGLVPTSLQLQTAPYFQDADILAAKNSYAEGLAAQNLKNDELFELTLLCPANERSHLVGQALQQQWFDAFGIRVKLESVEIKVYLDRVAKQDFQMAIGAWNADFADPINFLEVFKYKNSGSNNTHWENSRFAELLDQSYLTTDRSQRLDILRQSEQILMDEMPIIPVFYYSMLYVHKPALQDVVVTSMGQIDFKWASLNER